MIPRYHIIFGFISTLLFWIIFPSTKLIFLALFFISSILIDFDHYIDAVIKNKSLSLKKAFVYYEIDRKIWLREYKRGIRKKGGFHLFHTIEFIAFTGILSFVWVGFLYIFLGMVFHSILDIIFGLYEGSLYRREFILGNWLSAKLKNLIGN